ncbi:hypothetical protein HYALB_00006402 [Hymenoscyphus albidus]|uniref:Zinc/iron permease n=1 Tax=Hymenoscyphus albidus TaxID=595503 RepID=A0A9N9PTM0_9HELO|nr:hypothetical protein HYALB_00006402 [Hymenoscyphus albidus]
MESMVITIDNDVRGWIMCLVSGVACVIGASIICVDLIIQKFPGRRNFRIQDSTIFLASSLSLSFGVMLFSALYGILPSSKRYLERSGLASKPAAWVLLGFFMAGFVGIQIISRIVHQYMPSHVVDCDHTHEDNQNDHQSRRPSHGSLGQSLHTHHHGHAHDQDQTHHNHDERKVTEVTEIGQATESTPLLVTEQVSNKLQKSSITGLDGAGYSRPNSASTGRRPSTLDRVNSFVMDRKTNCDSNGPCHGYSDPCGHECFSIMSSMKNKKSQRGTILAPPLFDQDGNEIFVSRSVTRATSVFRSRSHSRERIEEEIISSTDDSTEDSTGDLEAQDAQHHHHVPENEFMAIGFQTSIAIALHKLPEGFITYATNHANPGLGTSVFMALFIHNISEGFIMALPLYLATGSRLRAMFVSSMLGGISQPLGAAIAATWFIVAGSNGHTPGERLYGCMFAVTAGIMTSVALMLFVEALSLSHNRNWCIAFGFLGMALMGASSALTA